MDTGQFYQKVALALTGCQLVEQELKLYITEALLLVHKCIAGRMTFNMSGEDYENSALEKLIKVFKKLSNNPALARDLDKFKDERNFLSHKAITSCLDLEGDFFESEANSLLGRLDNIQLEAKRLSNLLHLEANKFRGHLYFDLIDHENT